MTSITINAVHEHDALDVWKKLELKSKEQCLICNSDVTSETFAALGVYNKTVVVCCENGSCFYDFSKKVHK